MDSELQRRGDVADLDSMISGVHGCAPGYMCRKCYYAYEKVLNAKVVIEVNASIAPPISPKRSSPNPTVFPPPKRRPQQSLLSSSSTSDKEPSTCVSVSLE